MQNDSSNLFTDPNNANFSFTNFFIAAMLENFYDFMG